MKLNKNKSIELRNALLSPNLKAKHIPGENFVKLINLTRILKKELMTLGEQEEETARVCGADVSQGVRFENPEDIKAFNEKIKPIYDAFCIELELNFIPENELREYCKEQDTSVTSTIYEYLLKN